MEESEIRNLVHQILSAAPQLSMTDVERAVSTAVRSVVPPHEIDPVTLGFAEEQTTNNQGSGHGLNPTYVVRYPEAFRCTYDPSNEKYKINNPIVCTHSGPITATGADNLSTGSYYCKVSNEGGTFSAEITDSSEPDANTVVIVPIADITEDDGIHQKHIGTIIINGTERRSAWVFDPAAGTDEPHWKNPAVQCGWLVGYVSKGINDYADGTYYVDIDITSSEIDMTLRHGSSVPANTDDHIYLYVGKVENGEQTEGIYSMPYVFMYR